MVSVPESDPFERELWAVLAAEGPARTAALRALATRFPDRALVLEALLDEGVQLLPSPPPPEAIGPYRIVRRIGAGGMGEVWLARQDEPIERVVAVKLVKRGMDSERILARFHLERQVLALMDHPCIASVFDAGVTTGGQPWFAMEYVPGVAITEWCDRQRATLQERIELFRRVCDGVEHAHRKGVLHRDLKPSNLLVVEHDDRPWPKIIDFGLAKLLGADDVDAPRSEFTEPGNFVGTVDYMSPEQASLDARGIDTRTDVYSLGVVLYQLLVGELPFDRSERRASSDGRTEAPPRPSTRVSASAASQELAACRRIDVTALQRQLRHDLDWIVLRALEHDRERRYGSPRELADDLRRHLAHEPVLAGPPTFGYRARKFLRRRRGLVLAAAVILVTAIVGGVATFQQAAAKASALERFLLLARGVQLTDAEQEEAQLYPAWPEKAPAMRAWLRDRAEPLLGAMDDLRRAALVMRERADRRGIDVVGPVDPRNEVLTAIRAEVAAKRLQLAVADGVATIEPFVLPAEASALSAREIDAKVVELLGPSLQNARYGHEVEALSYARLLADKVAAGDGSVARGRALVVLAQACFRCGLLAEAWQHQEAHRDGAAPVDREGAVVAHRSMRQRIDEVQGPARRQYLVDLQARVESLERLVELPHLKFHDDSERFLYESLVRLLERLRVFAVSAGPVAAVRERLAAAETVREKTIDAHRAAWDEAIAAIAAHPAYGGLQLAPQVGLVPLGVDRRSGLWEFVHFASGDGDAAIPPRDDAGNVRPAPGMGIVLVLVPGAASLEPFFLGKFEVTQGQWMRLARGDAALRVPSALRVGMRYSDLPSVVGEHWPVESIDQLTVATWLERAGLALPTEAQWEHACRAGTTTEWYTGDEPASLAGHANLLDRTKEGVTIVGLAPFDDGCGLPGPVGFQRGVNAFGLADMHGNVAEWVADRFVGMDTALARQPAPGVTANRPIGVLRGGSAATVPTEAGARSRWLLAVTSRETHGGCRAAMSLQRATVAR